MIKLNESDPKNLNPMAIMLYRYYSIPMFLETAFVEMQLADSLSFLNIFQTKFVDVLYADQLK